MWTYKVYEEHELLCGVLYEPHSPTFILRDRLLLYLRDTHIKCPESDAGEDDPDDQ